MTILVIFLLTFLPQQVDRLKCWTLNFLAGRRMPKICLNAGYRMGVHALRTATLGLSTWSGKLKGYSRLFLGPAPIPSRRRSLPALQNANYLRQAGAALAVLDMTGRALRSANRCQWMRLPSALINRWLRIV